MTRPFRVAIMLDLEWSYKHHTAVFAGTQRYIGQKGWEPTIDEYVDDTLARARGELPYDGVIARATKPLAERAARMGVPLVNVWFSSPVRESLPGVFCDFTASGRLRAEHLLSRGLRRFACLMSRKAAADEVEFASFQNTLAEAGCSCTTAKIPLHFSRTVEQWRKTERTLAAWMDRWELPIGVFIRPDAISRNVVQMCRNRGWRVPEDVAVIAGQNHAEICEYSRPTLSSVEIGFERVGYEAARMLDRLMSYKRDLRKKSDDSSPPEHVFLPPQGLIARESTDFFAADDELVAAAMAFIAANCHRSIGPLDVARAVSTELRTLQRRFRQHLDRPIANEILRVRIERAKRELTQSDRSVSAIARNVGFGPRTQMYHVFRRELGVTPREYRKQRQLKEQR